eukprot:m.163109 g.163109  ORF g.163109 m.163109 type:complete len:734 (-) comp17682_c0_seq2:115-2316(-)
MVWSRWASLLVVIALLLAVCDSGSTPQQYLGTWVVSVRGGEPTADIVARDTGLVNWGRAAPHFPSHLWLFGLPGQERNTPDGDVVSPAALNASRQLQTHPAVHWHDQQRALRRVRREFEPPEDPLYQLQWYLGAQGPTLGQHHVWRQGITGRGVVIAVVDDGLEVDHPDIINNFFAKGSYDFNGNDPMPLPRYTDDNVNKHGTRCAGAAAASTNDVCGVGVAYEASISGIRMLDGIVSDLTEAAALSYQSDLIDIYSCSWGPDDDGMTFEGPGSLCDRALRLGTTHGRNGLGSVYVWASGNGGGEPRDNCNCDGYTSSRYTIAIGSTTEGGRFPGYAEACASLMAVAYSSGGPNEGSIFTTDLHSKCSGAFTGTSASAPLVSGLIALMLQANPCLSWRDVQHIVVRTSQRETLESEQEPWARNGAGLWHSHKFGFGLVSAQAAVELARNWTRLPPALSLQFFQPAGEPEPFSVGEMATWRLAVSGCDTTEELCITKAEHVEVTVEVAAQRRGDTTLSLVSPSGTRSILLTARPYDATDNPLQWTFMTVRHWGENPAGEWTLEVSSTGRPGRLLAWSLFVHGTAAPEDYLAATSTAYNFVANLPESRSNCKVCDTLSFPDGQGGCRLCHPNCTYGCSHPSRFACLEYEDLTFDGTLADTTRLPLPALVSVVVSASIVLAVCVLLLYRYRGALPSMPAFGVSTPTARYHVVSSVDDWEGSSDDEDSRHQVIVATM